MLQNLDYCHCNYIYRWNLSSNEKKYKEPYVKWRLKRHLFILRCTIWNCVTYQITISIHSYPIRWNGANSLRCCYTELEIKNFILHADTYKTFIWNIQFMRAYDQPYFISILRIWIEMIYSLTTFPELYYKRRLPKFSYALP